MNNPTPPPQYTHTQRLPPTKRPRRGLIIAIIVGASLIVGLCAIGGLIAIDLISNAGTTTVSTPLPADQTPDTDSNSDTGAPTGDRPTDDNQPATGTIGDTVVVSEWGDDVGSITVAEIETSTAPASEWGDEPQNGHFVTFMVELEAIKSMDVFSGDFYAVTEDGERFDEGNGNAYQAIDLGQSLSFAELNAGEHTSGTLVFDLPAPAGKLAYDPNWDGGPVAYWEFDAS